MHKRIISKLESGSNLRKNIKEEGKLFNAALSNVKFSATNIPYFPAMYSDILFDLRSFTSLLEKDTEKDVIVYSSGVHKDKDNNEKQRENLVENNLNIGVTLDKNDKTLEFPEQLMHLLSENKFEKIISWLPHGNSFLVYDKEKFTKIILPIYFKGTKYASFTRKLNRWSFTRTATGIETGAYSNKYFKRDEPILCKRMKCQKLYEIKKKTSRPEAESHYNMHPEHLQSLVDIAAHINIIPRPDFLARNQSMYSERYEKKLETIKSIDMSTVIRKAQDSVDASGMKMSPSPYLLAKNQKMCSKRNGKMQETVKSFKKSTVAVDTTDLDIIPSPRFLTANRSMPSERNEKKYQTTTSLDKARPLVDTIDVDITPPGFFSRNESNLMKLMELKGQQKEIDGLLQDIIQEASKQTEHAFASNSSSSEKRWETFKTCHNSVLA